MTDRNTRFSDMQLSVLDADETSAARLAAEALEAGLAPLETIEHGYLPGIRRAGELWEEGEFFLPELVGAAQAMKAAMEVLRPALARGTAGSEAGRVVIGTVQGDIHDIGKTLVATLLEANGFTVSDLGVDVPVERFVERAREIQADLVCASALLTTTMGVQGALVTAVREAGLGARVVVGGAATTREWAARIGADGHADNAVAAVALARNLMSPFER
jgi:corrinoid protein of di/trimethylamine methyltransferase